MIEPGRIPVGFTDDRLIECIAAWASEWEDEPAQQAAQLLTAPAEYRLGIEDRVDELGLMSDVHARRQALAELAAQGVALLPWPRT
jgi:hypothetical protein